jgi:hypothetical protein
LLLRIGETGQFKVSEVSFCCGEVCLAVVECVYLRQSVSVCGKVCLCGGVCLSVVECVYLRRSVSIWQKCVFLL